MLKGGDKKAGRGGPALNRCSLWGRLVFFALFVRECLSEHPPHRTCKAD